MSPRRAALLAVAFTLFACTDAKQDGAPEELVTVALYSPPRDPDNCAAPAASPNIPLPNDVALQRAPGLPAGVQRELLISFISNGGWPSDQEQAITLPIYRRTRDAATGAYVPAAAPEGLDPATLNDSTVALLRVSGTTVERVPFTATYVAPAAGAPAGTPGTLRIRPSTGRWAAGSRFVAAVRGGDAGVKTSTGTPLGADSPIALIAPDKDLRVRENLPLGGGPLDGACSPAGIADEVDTLERLRDIYGTPKSWVAVTDAANCNALAGIPVAPCWLPTPAEGTISAFDAVATVFPHVEIASIQTFTTQAGTRPVTDASAGTVPLPSDFLLDPTSPTPKVRNVPAFGPAAAGLATLDGFSVTAPLLIPLSGPVNAGATSVNRDSVRIYELTAGGPVQLRDLSALPGNTPQIVTQPPQFNQTVGGQSLATTLALAPAVPVQLPPEAGGAFVPVPPLKEKSRYLVVVTNDVLDAAGSPLKRSTLMNIIFSFTSPLYDDAGTPADPADDVNHAASLGLSAGDARGLQALRDGLTPALTALGLRDCSGTARCAVLAYTVTTQSVKDVSRRLPALPYGVEAAAATAIFTPVGATEVPLSEPADFPHVATTYRANFNTVWAIDPATGAFDPRLGSSDPAVFAAFVAENTVDIPALVVVPNAASAALQPNCPGGPPASLLRCVPLVVFHHGLGGGRMQAMLLADSLAAKGFAVVAVDAPYHGDRAFCRQNSDCAVEGGADGVCTPDAAKATQGDAVPPGECTTGELRFDATRLTTSASGAYFISQNFFRIRDGFRQGLIDQSAAVLAFARPPVGVPQPAANPVRDALGARGIAIDPTRVYFLGTSLGGVNGGPILATNPRFRRGVLWAPAGTATDAIVNSPGLAGTLDPILNGLLGTTDWRTAIQTDPAVAQRFVQTTSIAKWILDPADPINYAPQIVAKTYDPGLEPLVAGGAGSATTDALGLVISGDQTLSDTYGRLLLGLGAVPTTLYTADAAIAAADRHSLIGKNFLAPTDPLQLAGDEIRADVANFLDTGTRPPATKTVPSAP